MGKEARCTASFDGRTSEGTALLETDELRFRGRGEVRLRIPRAEMRDVVAHDGTLTLRFGGAAVSFTLGPAAARWADDIAHPRSVLDKLGVKPAMRVAMLGIRDADFHAQVRVVTPDISVQAPRKDTDLIFLGAESARDLARLATLRRSLKPSGAIWVVHRKGKDAPLEDTDVFAAGRRAGLVDTKVCAFSATHTAEKLVIPKAKR
jgi:hypothetical protein